LIVLDASALLEALLPTGTASALQSRLFATGETWHAPHLLDVEFTQGIRRHSLAGNISGERAAAAFADYADMSIQRHIHMPLLRRVRALRNNLTAYDAVYVALAEALDATLLTRDRRIANAAGHQARVELV
jgi:predicted nucleic acid-binding protein